MVLQKTIHIQTKGNSDMVDVTSMVAREITDSQISSGIATLFVSGSTAAITTIEHESGLIHDFETMWERNVPRNISYQHDSRWGDGNGFSHIRASLLGPSLVVPFTDKKMTLGTWQQIIVVDFDNRPRSREITVQLIGE